MNEITVFHAGKDGFNPTPATQPTLYFIGVTTGKSSIMKVFPEWAKAMGIDAVIKGIDFKPHSSPEEYREAVEFINGNLYLNIYFQMDNTDTNICEKYLNFFKGEEYHGKHYTTNKYGDTIPHYFTYNRENKAGVIKSILLEYVHTKYADKL